MVGNVNLWVFNHYAETPDGSATRTFELCRALVRKGHDATIFASSYSHYRLREEHFSGSLRWSSAEMRDGVRFVWLRGFPYRSNDWRRVTNMAGYGILALARGLALRPKPDVVIGCSVHPCAAMAGLAIARLTAAPFLLEVPDLWPQVLVDLGRLKPRGIRTAVLRSLEKRLFGAAGRIIMLWRDTQPYVRGRGIDPAKIVWIPHVIDPRQYAGVPAYAERPRPFTAMYVGSFVQSMGLDTLLDAARILEREGRRDIRIVLIGDGAEKPRLVARARELALGNLEIRDPVAKSQVPKVLAAADCLVCCFRNSPVYRYGLSMNKLCDYLMSGRPVVLSGDSSYDPVAEGGAGLSVRGEDPASLASSLAAMADLRFEVREEMGKRGIAWARAHHDVTVLANRLEETLQSTLAPAEVTA
jgi:glycosyltransferase involved in cell wall biosynthesis